MEQINFVIGKKKFEFFLYCKDFINYDFTTKISIMYLQYLHSNLKWLNRLEKILLTENLSAQISYDVMCPNIVQK